jgi:hypothetical protein
VSIALLREMFDQMVVAKNAELVERYYDRDFAMYSDGLTQNFTEFRDSHREIYATSINYAIEYDEQCVGGGQRQSGRAVVDHHVATG